jgi:hypothetical protein
VLTTNRRSPPSSKSARLAQEAQLLNFLIDGQTNSVRMAHAVRVHVGGVDGLVHEVPTADVLEALRDELVQLELVALSKGRL